MQKRKQTRARRKPRAATKDILGSTKPNHREVPRKWRQAYHRLMDLRDRVLRRQSDLTKDALEEQPGFSTHMADAGTDTYDRDLALGMLSTEQDALLAIDEAINRIHDGSYGICELTGKRIEPERLQAIPWARFSAAAEKQLEREGALGHAQLGPRNAVTRVEVSAGAEDEED
jgi:RNA polymerase-binding transcription factor DksA